MLWSSKKPTDATKAGRSHYVGLELNSSRIRATLSEAGRSRTLALDPTGVDELPLAISVQGRTPIVGRDAVRQCRVSPHWHCGNFLARLGISQEWRGPRLSFTPETALLTSLETARVPLANHANRCSLVVPAYLSAAQTTRILALATKAKITISHAATLPLALAAHRSNSILNAPTPADRTDTDGTPAAEWVVPIRPPETGPGAVIILEVDDYALSATAIQIDADHVRQCGHVAQPRASMKLWHDRLIDCLSDRCVRLCRRDPRDNAALEQSLFDQLPDALERMRQSQPATLTVRAEKWYQDLLQYPPDFEGYCTSLSKLAVETMKELLGVANLMTPPRAIWLTHSAANLPGLASAIYYDSAESTDVGVLPPDAGAEAAAYLQSLSERSEHPILDHTIRLPKTPPTITKTNAAR